MVCGVSRPDFFCYYLFLSLFLLSSPPSSCHHPSQTSSFTWLDTTPHPTGPWTVVSSSVAASWGTLDPPTGSCSCLSF